MKKVICLFIANAMILSSVTAAASPTRGMRQRLMEVTGGRPEIRPLFLEHADSLTIPTSTFIKSDMNAVTKTLYENMNAIFFSRRASEGAELPRSPRAPRISTNPERLIENIGPEWNNWIKQLGLEKEFEAIDASDSQDKATVKVMAFIFALDYHRKTEKLSRKSTRMLASLYLNIVADWFKETTQSLQKIEEHENEDMAMSFEASFKERQKDLIQSFSLALPDEISEAILSNIKAKETSIQAHLKKFEKIHQRIASRQTKKAERLQSRLQRGLNYFQRLNADAIHLVLLPLGTSYVSAFTFLGTHVLLGSSAGLLASGITIGAATALGLSKARPTEASTQRRIHEREVAKTQALSLADRALDEMAALQYVEFLFDEIVGEFDP